MEEKIRKVTDKVLILKPFIALLAQGRIIKLVFAWFLRIAAAVFILGFLYRWAFAWEMVFKMSGALVLVLSILMLLSLVFVYAIINMVLIKADAIIDLPESKDYIVIPVSVIITRLAGEIALCVSIFAGIAGFLVSLTQQGGMVLRMIPFFDGSGVQAGLTGLAAALVFGFVFLFLSYLVAEQIGVFADIARNTKRNS